FDIVQQLKTMGATVAILSDQTNWLDELDARFKFFHLFDAVFNSYHLGKSKADESQFPDTIARLNGESRRALFIDDDEAHCERARKAGLNAIRYAGRETFLKDLGHYFPEIVQ
ncbi:MAG: HAD family hydrolase, partial [Syntrophorhabdus sp.]